MRLEGISTAVTGGARGLGLATTRMLAAAGCLVTVIDLPDSGGEAVAAELGDAVRFAPADVTDADRFAGALDAADERGGLRALVHCAGAARKVRLLDRDGEPGSVADFDWTLRLNLTGTFNALRLGAARMARHEPVAGERGAIVLTASIAAYEGQIGQLPYTAAKAGITGMTLTAARDLASRAIRVCTIAPGVMDTRLLARLRPDVRDALAAGIPHPARLGHPGEFASLAGEILRNAYLNGETIRLDGALRMAPR
ncbi:SDR family NAD(P)-dependent oxidoreductase [Streptomyces sp. NBC_01808]|uniref:SDR family NAD(P)-dependent oxidoreductase n=1 Tax=Streptomyces sp. NBC_01808 TaxID=2975947 RepID=UPI002DDBD8F2|nr:SDR family NAD(P)-dependent oxidoreductase [Streptomyces sp. NBC_01808]WSA36290.1 SDR family NAD(P)-dependent oxidoreductase [Streptomyces sp. NBC_01808]